MSKAVSHPIGSSFESFLAEDGILEAVDEAAVKEVIAWQVAQAMRERQLTKSAMAEAMKTSRTQVERLLDPSNTGVNLHTLYRAANVLGKHLRVEMVNDKPRARRSTAKRRRSPARALSA
jgi:hypothetical protein